MPILLVRFAREAIVKNRPEVRAPFAGNNQRGHHKFLSLMARCDTGDSVKGVP